MRVSSGNRIELARAISAEGGRRDSELEIPPDIFPVLEIPDALKSLRGIGVPALFTQSAVFAQEAYNVDVAAAATVDSPGFSPGLWRLRMVHTMQFVGTVTVFSNALAQIVDPDGFATVISRIRAINTPMLLQRYLDWTVSLDRPGWLLRVQVSATVLGDRLRSELNFSANRLL